APLDGAGSGTLVIQVTGTWTGTLTFNGSTFIDDTNYQTINCTLTNGTSAQTTTAANGVFACAVAGLRRAQVIFTAYTSGTAVVQLHAVAAGGAGGGGGGGGGASDVTIHDPTITTQKAAVNASGQLSITCANCSG